VAKTETAWRCSQCGTVNEPGARACSGCGKWPSLFDLQNAVGDAPAAGQEPEPELFDPEPFDPETLDPEMFEPEVFDPRSDDAGTTATQATETVEPETFEPEAEDEAAERRTRLRRWAISAIWVIGIIIWFVANTFGNR
jgi:hypothetical protein